MPFDIAPHYDVAGQYLDFKLIKKLTYGHELFWENTKAEKGTVVEQEQMWQTCTKTDGISTLVSRSCADIKAGGGFLWFRTGGEGLHWAGWCISCC